MDVHTCRCIWFIAMSGWIQNSKWIQNAFENEFENGFEIKENKNKNKLENKRVSKGCIIYFLKHNKSSYPVFESKVYRNNIWIRFDSYFKLVLK